MSQASIFSTCATSCFRPFCLFGSLTTQNDFMVSIPKLCCITDDGGDISVSIFLLSTLLFCSLHFGISATSFLEISSKNCKKAYLDVFVLITSFILIEFLCLSNWVRHAAIVGGQRSWSLILSDSKIWKSGNASKNDHTKLVEYIRR